MAKQLNSAREVIETLGGPTKVGKLTGNTGKAVWNWYIRGLPRETFIVLKCALVEKGFDAPSSLWGMKEIAREAAQ